MHRRLSSPEPASSQPVIPVRWLNPSGYTDPPCGYIKRFFFITVPLVRVKLDPEYPLSLLWSDGSISQCNKDFVSDKATAPFLFSWWIPRDLFPRAAYTHDSDCEDGAQFVCRRYPKSTAREIADGGRVYLPFEWFIKEEFSRKKADQKIFHTCQLDGCSIGRARAVLAGVRIGAAIGIGSPNA